ncbi:multidrug ABC transporter permease [Microvirga sp. KLBC 81]|uniref:ABC transporter permease n=1 Tax=Microvirga sp. KLBC 81 TaxID=1862707 RepID=UPI000D524D84|nr:ABC transporter permease [Microvirga sp. KLBC 81]PVE23606.1 multidrug ABC transporter permease [Microvirga sp. KLBC 81]
MKMRYGMRALAGIMRREMLRFIGQRGRFAAAIVRPLVWLGIFAVGFRSVLGLSIMPPYQTYILYEVYIVPGLAGMMLLFHGMQGSLSMVYDREMGSMRVLLTAPLPRWWLLGARLLANTVTVLPVVYLFLLLARFWDVRPPPLGYVAALPALTIAGLTLAAFGLALSSMIRQLENFAGVMNFVIFPLFFASTALYPLWRLEEVSPALAAIAWLNPFSHAVELVRFALYLQFEPVAFAVCVLALVVFLGLAVWGYDPGRGFWARRVAE